MSLAYETIRAALAAQPLFEAKSWQLSPEAWPLTPEQVARLRERSGKHEQEMRDSLRPASPPPP